MNITKARLTKIIKEEISTLKERDFTHTVIPFLEDVMSSISKAHDSLPAGPRGKEFFEEALLYNIELMMKKWRAEQEDDEAAAQQLLEPA